MVTTRSKKAQTRLRDFTNGKTPPIETGGKTKATPSFIEKAFKGTPGKASKKRKGPPSSGKTTSTKRTKRSEIDEGDSSGKNNIVINRAPVLQLWTACVTSFLHPSLEWSTCLSVGSSISTICAVSKGRSIGKINRSEDDKEKKNKKREQAKEQQKNLDILEVMHFKLKLRDGLALVGNEHKGKPANETLLRTKFGDEGYEAAKGIFQESLESWRGDEEELNEQAFKFYEGFRPDVASGQKGWGRKGELDLEKARKVIQR
ncbi:hypothetical protein K432DRAFT_384741 [Lepidopterella palustris CBS 459.81]|uniref:Uncharacterized protein n=1 Tax=Lepidopterella palustris CBS 459.81 TaxID=1314670 RepID=A0A8E2E4Q7_9PEZI|nr:hypothetical protein K432DRAFT_384741 [Lepidopterella palustris CBS 459.81]